MNHPALIKRGVDLVISSVIFGDATGRDGVTGSSFHKLNTDGQKPAGNLVIAGNSIAGVISSAMHSRCLELFGDSWNNVLGLAMTNHEIVAKGFIKVA